MSGPTSSTLDFWVALREQPAGEFWLVVDDQHESSSTSSAADLPQHVHGLPLRPITTTLLASLTIAAGELGADRAKRCP